MSDLQAEFESCQEEVKQLSSRPSNNDLLTLYATFKQATTGDVQGKRPGMLDVAGRAKYDAWAKLSGSDADSAMQTYIDKVRELQAAD
ncbi:MAG: acyl-CoA-binding protein [Gammaproteobacteria bacterium]|nr:acyl-CoA-binding protein [Gammaproteobacteria bacterium]